VIRAQAVCYGIGIADEHTIDAVNILQATILAMERALQALNRNPISCSSTLFPSRVFRCRKSRSLRVTAAATPSLQRQFLPR